MAKSRYVAYINVGQATCKKARKHLKKVAKHIRNGLGKKDKLILIPIRDGNSRIERLA
jgi:hypothetical protein